MMIPKIPRQVYIKLGWFILYAHLLEHITQMMQVYLLHWDRANSLGILGVFLPWLVRSEWLHYGFSLFTVLFMLPLSKVNKYYYCATILALFHHVEHFGLLVQALFNEHWFGGNKPMTFLEQFIPRIELHFIYNLIVLTPILMCHFTCRKKY